MSNQLPALQDLYKGDYLALQKENALNVLLNQPPKKEWIKSHPTAKEVKYLTIARVEFLLTSIFIQWDIEIKTVQQIANSVVVTVRLHYKNPVTGEMQWTDGVGAAPIQTDKGAGATDFSKVKNDAVMKAAPAAKSFAVKDAAHKLGNLFGADLNRKDEIMYDNMLNRFDMKKKLEAELSNQLKACQDEGLRSKVMEEAFNAEEEGKNDEQFYVELLKKHFNYEVAN
jgi:hypothetical protein